MARLVKAGQRNYTSVASENERSHGKFHVDSPPVADMPSCLILNSVDDNGVLTPRYIWVDDTGVLRVGTSAPTDQNSDGTIVGSQS